MITPECDPQDTRTIITMVQQDEKVSKQVVFLSAKYIYW